MAQLKLYYLKHTDYDGESYDLLVNASSKKEACVYWKSYFEDSDLPAKPFLIEEVPVAETPGAISWEFLFK